MEIIRNKIRLTNSDTNIKLTLKNVNDSLGYDQDVSNLITCETKAKINKPSDNDLTLYSLESETTLTFNFFGTAYTTSFLDIGFESGDTYNAFGKKSFFIADTYTTYDISNQEKISQNYINGIKSLTSTYNINGNKLGECREFYHWYVSDNYFTGNTLTTYTKFSFFNAKTGNVNVFYNKDNELLTNELKLYIPTIFNLETKTFKFDKTTINLYELINESYRQRIQRSLNPFGNKTPNLPSGTTFMITTSGITYQ